MLPIVILGQDDVLHLRLGCSRLPTLCSYTLIIMRWAGLKYSLPNISWDIFSPIYWDLIGPILVQYQIITI